MISNTNPLDVRVAYALAKIKASIFSEVAIFGVDVFGNCVIDAYEIGRSDYKNGRFEMSVFFNDESELADAWCAGQDREQSDEEDRKCPHCSSKSFDPCPVHG